MASYVCSIFRKKYEHMSICSNLHPSTHWAKNSLASPLQMSNEWMNEWVNTVFGTRTRRTVHIMAGWYNALDTSLDVKNILHFSICYVLSMSSIITYLICLNLYFLFCKIDKTTQWFLIVASFLQAKLSKFVFPFLLLNENFCRKKLLKYNIVQTYTLKSIWLNELLQGDQVYMTSPGSRNKTLPASWCPPF
jgi:hypothetical protein